MKPDTTFDPLYKKNFGEIFGPKYKKMLVLKVYLMFKCLLYTCIITRNAMNVHISGCESIKCQGYFNKLI